MSDPRQRSGDRIDVHRSPELAAELLDALPEDRTGITTEAEAWRYAVSRYLAEHRDEFKD